MVSDNFLLQKKQRNWNLRGYEMKEKFEQGIQEIWELFIWKRSIPSLSSASSSNLLLILKKLKWNTANSL